MILKDISTRKPEEKAQDALPELGDAPSIVQVEDRVITEFCKLNGGIEVGMPIVREQIRKLSINFQSPTKMDLIKLTNSLNSITDMLRGPKSSTNQKTVFNDLLIKVP